MSKTSQRIFDANKSFADSLFWQGQRDFYHQKGVTAWSGEVPFYITSNPFIAEIYAEIILRFIQDWSHQHKRSLSKPFYIIELGAGSGQFSFYILRALQNMKKTLNLKQVKLQYIMTDFTETNLKFWQQHPQLMPFVKNKILDFGLFDIEKDESIKTINQGLLLEKSCSENPILICANYLFDSIINDIFLVQNGKLMEELVSLATVKANIIKDSPLNWKNVKVLHKPQPVKDRHYSDPVFNEILNNYKKILKRSFVLFPIGCLRGLNALKSFANGKLLLISSDKGHSTPYELDELGFPELDFHGSFSLMVNYHAISEYFIKHKGESRLQTPRDGLISAVFSSGFYLHDLPETSLTLDRHIEGFSPTDYFNYYELIERFHNQIDLKTLATTLCLSHWDPFLFEVVSGRISELFNKENSEIIDYLINNLPKIIDNFYYVPGCEDVYFSAGNLLYNVDHFKEAIIYYKLSQDYFEGGFENNYNLALCYFYLDQFTEAAEYAKQALLLQPKNKEAKQLLSRSKQKLKKTK